ncbi:MAG: hypothetical protein ACLFPL_02320 [Candidatus Nanoarchaeia archaeon]
MISKRRFHIFIVFAILLIINTIYLYPWNLSFSLFESSWIVFGTIGAMVSYYIALLSNYAPFQTFVMRILFWAYSIMLFLSVMRRTFEYLGNGIPFFAFFNTVFYLIIVLLIAYEGYKLYHSYGRNKHIMYSSASTSTSKDDLGIESISTQKNNSSRKDDLTIIEGVGPVIQEILYKHKITSFKQLSNTPAYKIKEILDNNDLHTHSPKTWPKQAELAHKKKWDELYEWQEELMGGRE